MIKDIRTCRLKNGEEMINKLILVKDGKSEYKIQVNENMDKIEQFAVHELRKYVKQIAGIDLDTITKTDNNQKTIVFGNNKLNGEGFGIFVDNNKVVISSGNSRGKLYGVYSLVEKMGMNWLSPGFDEEKVHQRKDIVINNVETIEKPDFSIRCFCWDAGYMLHGIPNDEVFYKKFIFEYQIFLDWLAKNKINRIFMCHLPNHLFRKELIEEANKRGLEIEYGGHILNNLLPRELFKNNPNLFRFTNGQRVSNGNFCTSNPKTLEIVSNNALQYIQNKRAGGKVYHFFSDDVWGGSWCQCSKCKNLTPFEQYLIVMNKIGRSISKYYPDIKITMCAYHDTLSTSKKIKAEDNIFCVLGPRERCYAHSINSESCVRNKYFRKKIEEAYEIFGRNLYMFEYYQDPILYRSMAIPLSEIIEQDLKYYHRLGIDKIQSLQFGPYSWWAYPLNFPIFSQFSWKIDSNREKIISEYCNMRYGKVANIMKDYFDNLEQSLKKAIIFHYKGEGFDMRYPPASYDKFALLHSKYLKNSIRDLQKCSKLLDHAYKGTANPKTKILVFKEQLIFKYTETEIKAYYGQIEGHRKKSRQTLEQAKRAIQENIDFMNSIDIGIKGFYACSELPLDHKFVKELLCSENSREARHTAIFQDRKC